MTRPIPRLVATALVCLAAAGACYAAVPLLDAGYIHVRWTPSVDAGTRQELERRFALESGRWNEGTTWTYLLSDVSRRNVEAIVTSDTVEDTHYINRSEFTLAADAPRVPKPWTGNGVLQWLLRQLALVLGAAGAGALALAIAGRVAGSAHLTRPPLRQLADTYLDPASTVRAAGDAIRTWAVARIPAATARSVALFRILFGAALLWFFVSNPVDATWLPGNAPGDGLTALQRATVRLFTAAPLLADVITPVLVVACVLFIAGAATRTSYALLVMAAVAWGSVYSLRVGAHAYSALLVALVCMLPSRWGDAWSLDGWRAGRSLRANGLPAEYGYTMWVPGLVLGITLAAAAFAKCREAGLDWILNGTVKYHFLTDSPQALVDWGLRIGSYPGAAVALSLGAVLVEGLVIAAVLTRSYVVRLAGGIASLMLLVGFLLFQGLFWPAWWILLLSFLPWHLVRVRTPGEVSDRRPMDPRLHGLVTIQLWVVLALVVQQVLVSALRLEVDPLFSAYNMYSTTYASPAAYEQAAGMEYWVKVDTATGASTACDVTVDEATHMTAAFKAREPDWILLRRVLTRCGGDPAQVTRVTLGGTRDVIDWTHWRLAGQTQTILAGPFPLPPQ